MGLIQEQICTILCILTKTKTKYIVYNKNLDDDLPLGGRVAWAGSAGAGQNCWGQKENQEQEEVEEVEGEGAVGEAA